MGVYEYPSESLFTTPWVVSPGVELLGLKVTLTFLRNRQTRAALGVRSSLAWSPASVKMWGLGPGSGHLLLGPSQEA